MPERDSRSHASNPLSRSMVHSRAPSRGNPLDLALSKQPVGAFMTPSKQANRLDPIPQTPGPRMSNTMAAVRTNSDLEKRSVTVDKTFEKTGLTIGQLAGT